MNLFKKFYRDISSPIIIIGALFFVFGFVTWLSAILVPYLKIACELTNFQSYLVAFSFYIAYFFMSVPSGWFLEYTGYKNGMTAGLVIMAIGSLFFVPAALTRTYGLFLTGLFIQGAGMALLQTASNPYVTIIGPIESAAKRISIMGICNGIAGVLAPAILGFITLKGADEIVLKISTMTPVEKKSGTECIGFKSDTSIYPDNDLITSSCRFPLFQLSLPDIDAEEENAITDDDASNKTNIFQFLIFCSES